MDRIRTETAILSVSTPGVEPAEGAEAAAMARELNAYCHQLTLDHPGRFGYFATLTLPDVDRAITEMNYANDELGADGVVLFTDAKGTYLGDPSFDPLMAELNERDAVVFIHPQGVPGGEVKGIPAYAADFLLDATRAALNLARNGVLNRFPRIKFILSHGGGMIPYVALRLAPTASPKGKPLDGLRQLRRFYYDTALMPSPFSMPAYLRFVPWSHATFGSDYPYGPEYAAVSFSRLLTIYPTLRHHAINRGNAEKLFPRFAD